MPKSVSHTKSSLTLKRVAVDILEFGPGLFHEESPVLMPALTGRDNQAKALGIKTLGAVFKQYEFDPRKRAVIASHTDTGGDTKEKFQLSELRAKNVRWLLTGDINYWSRLSTANHTIKDCKRIMYYFRETRDWDCDPGAIDDSYKDMAHKATKAFFRECKLPKSEALADAVKKDEKHRWPLSAWKAVYRLYQDEIRRALGISAVELKKRRKQSLKFVGTFKKYVACGESFPLTEPKKDNGYNDKKERRVEILFFYNDEAPGVRKGSPGYSCPSGGTRKHVAKECPIYFAKHLKATYLDPEFELKAIAYHLKFVYYNRVKEALTPVPDGLKIKAYTYETVGRRKNRKEIEAFSGWHDGVYMVKVKDENRDSIYFEFKTPKPKDENQLSQWWVYMSDKNTDPIIRQSTPVDVKRLFNKELHKRIHYYDLPMEWSSENYWTRYQNSMTVGEAFDEVMKTKLSLKPYGAKTTSANSPLMFSLDDVVLTDGTGKQTVQDQDQAGASKAPGDDSRITLLYLDKAEKFKVKVYKPREKAAYFSEVEFKRNLIYDVDPAVGVVVFCSAFYHIHDRRTERAGGLDFSKGHILGARAARLDDDAVSYKRSFRGTDGSDEVTKAYLALYCGDYDLHYVHHWGLDGARPVSALILHWSCRLTVDGAQGGVAADKKNFAEEGFENAMVRLNAKDYELEALSGPKNTRIKMSVLLEVKLDTRGGKNKTDITLVSDETGSSINITDGNATFRHSAYAEETVPFGGTSPDPLNSKADYDGSKTKRLTVAHEQGHASGWDDDYTQSVSGYYPLVRYSQANLGWPYSIDELSIMKNNHATRMRHFWGFVNWINDEAAAGKHLNGFLDGTAFQILHKDIRFELTKAKYRNIYKAAYDSGSDNTANAPSRMDLLLYKIGNDEFANTLTGSQKYTGLLAVRIKISVAFVDGDPTEPDEQWTNAWKGQWLRAFNQRCRAMTDQKFRVACGDSTNDFANTYVFVLPHFEVRDDATDAAGAGTHYELEVTLDYSDSYSRTGGKIEVGSSVDNRRIVRGLFGLDAGLGDLTTDNLADLVKWMKHNTVANGTFAAQSL